MILKSFKPNAAIGCKTIPTWFVPLPTFTGGLKLPKLYPLAVFGIRAYDILTNDYYKKVSRDEVMAGDVVLYKLDSDVTHVGLVIRAELVHPTSRTLDITMLAHVNYKCAATSVAIKAGVMRLRLI